MLSRVVCLGGKESLWEAVKKCASQLPTGPGLQFCAVFTTANCTTASDAANLVWDSLPHKPPVVGCVVDAIDGHNEDAAAIVYYNGPAVGPITPFFDAIRDIRPKAVGRYAGKDATIPVKADISRLRSSATIVADVQAPEPLRHAFEAPPAILLFGDKRVEHAIAAIDQLHPQSHKVGIIGASTVFLNSKEHTLFYNEASYSNGVAGVVLPSVFRRQLGGVYPQKLRPIGPADTITRCKGNILLETAASSRPAKMLLDAIATSGKRMHKEEKLFLSYSVSQHASPAVYHITSGDPSRGQISLDTIRELKPGAQVQFLVSEANDPNEMAFLDLGVKLYSENGIIATSSDGLGYVIKHPGGSAGFQH